MQPKFLKLLSIDGIFHLTALDQIVDLHPVRDAQNCEVHTMVKLSNGESYLALDRFDEITKQLDPYTSIITATR